MRPLARPKKRYSDVARPDADVSVTGSWTSFSRLRSVTGGCCAVVAGRHKGVAWQIGWEREEGRRVHSGMRVLMLLTL